MKNLNKMIMLSTILFVTITMIGLAFPTSTDKYEIHRNSLISAIVFVESKGNPNAKSKDGSVGIMQIKPVMVNEVNRILRRKCLPVQYTLDDRKDPKKSMEMFWVFQSFYNPDVIMDSISISDMEILSRKWNGGPNGHKKSSTQKYWKKVSKVLASRYGIESYQLSNM
jgi:hypothetical protein